jgi:hypothetical protein
MPAILAKCQSMLQALKQKLLFYGLSNAQIESIKGKKQISPYTTFIVLTADMSEIAATEGSYVMEGAAIIKLAALSTSWLEVSSKREQCKIIENWAKLRFPLRIILPKRWRLQFHLLIGNQSRF